jgi:hypothetical protein
VEGRIVAMECGETPTLILETEQGRKAFPFLQPNGIAMTGRLPLEGLPCGLRKNPLSVRIGYDPMPEGVAGDGVVREIRFQ